ncbi:hypothetical protein Tco_0374262 [Tanacetum coccineum]
MTHLLSHKLLTSTSLHSLVTKGGFDTPSFLLLGHGKHKRENNTSKASFPTIYPERKLLSVPVENDWDNVPDATVISSSPSSIVDPSGHRGWRRGDDGDGVEVVLWWAAVGRQPEEVEARGGEWIWGSGRSGHEDNIFIKFWVRRSLAGKVAGGGGGGRNNSPEKMEGMEEEDDVCPTTTKGGFGFGGNEPPPPRGVRSVYCSPEKGAFIRESGEFVLGYKQERGAFGCDSHPMGAFGVVYNQLGCVWLYKQATREEEGAKYGLANLGNDSLRM